MSNRDRILARLKSGLKDIEQNEIRSEQTQSPVNVNSDVFFDQLKAANADVRICEQHNWTDQLIQILDDYKIEKLNVAAERFPELSSMELSGCQQIDVYSESNIDPKNCLFDEIDASLTTVQGGICETGSLIIIPDEIEPRSVSLVVPVHIAVIHEHQLFGSFSDFVKTQNENRMPTNIILATGPSKTADIQQTLAYGAHGPKHMVVLFFK